MDSNVLASYQLVFQTDKGTVYQCDRTNRLILSFWGTNTPLSARDFSQFRRMVQTVNIHQMALSTEAADEVEIFTLPRLDRCYVLTLCEILHLRELLNGAVFTLELNSILRECGCSTLSNQD
ncbi:hypothetical protein GO730_08575 [Spirosoma sp. HMF3257]|uniref:Uncharacterized protein n=1 Tax=Spirosoma telluris TaxID=2183553 RepID=A0A327NG51_9BACT|nr:hypothetical protein [Spirosoma telluris]RAI74331.1 hypothetical protein HMF3257_08485 [Spirosoma telluris]